jgi:CRP-like cAMP-binding protein
MSKAHYPVIAHTVRAATPADCAVCPAEGIGLFSGEFRVQRSYLVEGFRIVQVPFQGTLYRFGDAADYVFLLRYGLMKLVRYSAAGEERIVRLARAGDTIGLEALTGDSYRHAAKAISVSALCRVPKKVILEEKQAEPQFIDRVMVEMQREIEQADLFLTELSTGSAEARVARLLLYLSEREDERACTLPMREEIGALLGVTMETASRIVADLRRRGLVQPTEDVRRIVLDAAALRRIAAV